MRRRDLVVLLAGRLDALLLGPEPAFGPHARLIIELAQQSRLPAMYPYNVYAENGALMAYTFETTELARRVADDVHQVLHGAKPGDIPVFQATPSRSRSI